MQSEDREVDVRGEIERLVRPLIRAFEESDLVRMAVDDEQFALEVVRRTRPAHAAAAAARAASAAEHGGSARSAGVPERPMEAVTADVVGIFRGSRPFAEVGQIVEASRELGYVEALGIRNPVRAGRAGVMAAVFVRDGDPVEYGQPLFGIEAASPPRP